MKKFLFNFLSKSRWTTRQAAKKLAAAVRPEEFFRVSDQVERPGNGQPDHRYEVVIVTRGGTSIRSNEPTLEFTVTKALAAYCVTT